MQKCLINVDYCALMLGKNNLLLGCLHTHITLGEKLTSSLCTVQSPRLIPGQCSNDTKQVSHTTSL